MKTMIMKLLNNVQFQNSVSKCRTVEKLSKVCANLEINEKLKNYELKFFLTTQKKFKIIFCPNCEKMNRNMDV